MVDPYMPFPHQDDEGEGFGGLGAGEERRNVWLEAKNGNVDAEIWVVRPDTDDDNGGGGGGEGRKRAGIDVRAKNGFVHVKMVSILYSFLSS